MPEFELLCDNLHLTAELEDTDQLERLKSWWQKEVSSDITYHGTPREEYNQYFSAAKRYTNVFLAHKFDKMNPIQYAALEGYDHYLNRLNEGNATFDQPNTASMTPLHQAALKGYVNTV